MTETLTPQEPRQQNSKRDPDYEYLYDEDASPPGGEADRLRENRQRQEEIKGEVTSQDALSRTLGDIATQESFQERYKKTPEPKLPMLGHRGEPSSRGTIVSRHRGKRGR